MRRSRGTKFIRNLVVLHSWFHRFNGNFHWQSITSLTVKGKEALSAGEISSQKYRKGFRINKIDRNIRLYVMSLGEKQSHENYSAGHFYHEYIAQGNYQWYLKIIWARFWSLIFISIDVMRYLYFWESYIYKMFPNSRF